MQYLHVKFFRDLKKLWSQFFSVFMMAMISMTIFSGMNCVWNGMKASSEEYFADTNLADVWVYAGQITDRDMEAVRELSYVKNAEAAMSFSVEGRTGKESDTELRVVTLKEESLRVLNPLIRSGEHYSDTNGIWIDEDYAAEHDLSAGDTIDVSINDEIFEVIIKGTVLDAENIYFVTYGTDSVPNHLRYGYAYMSEAYVRDLLGAVVNNQIRIDMTGKSGVSKEQVRKDMEEVFNERLYSVSMREDMPSIWQVQKEQEQIKKMAVLFSIVFVLLSLLTMYTTMSRLVNNQVVQIGTMKAMGFYKRQIYGHYALYGMAVSLLGGSFGILAGRLFISELVMNIKKTTLTLPEWSKVLGTESAVLWLSIVLICTLAAILTARKVIKGVPAQIIRGIVEQKQKSDKPLKRSRLSYEWLWTLRAIKVHPARYIMGVVAIAGSMILMVAGIGVWDSINSSYDDVFKREYTYQYSAAIKKGGDKLLQQELADDNVQYSEAKTAVFRKNDMEKSGVLSIISDGTLLHLFLYESGEEQKLPSNGAFITYKLAKQMGVREGDIIRCRPDTSAEEFQIEIKAVVDAKMPQGIFLSEAAWKEEFTPNTVYLGNASGYEAIEGSDLVTGLTSIDEQRENMDTMLESVRSIMYILILAALVLSAVILYNLGTLSFIERYREYATMKVLGFYKKEINRMVLTDCGLNLLTGMVLGAPGSLAFLNLYVGVVSMENMEWTPYISPVHFVTIALIIAIFSILINLFVCRKVRKVDMVEALKSVD